MVVEDATSVAKLVATHLESAGYRVDIAASGPEAFEKLRHAVPDLLVVDVMMPGMDGFQVTQLLRSDPRTAHTPVIILTARDSVEDKVRGFEAGADDYMVKPFQAPELLARVRALLARVRPTATVAATTVSGTAIAIFGLRGGAGRSSIAANLAVALASQTSERVVLCDLAIETGHLALMMDAKPIHTLDELVTRYGASPEADVLMAYLTGTRYGPSLLAAPLSPASAPLVTVEGVRAVIEGLRHHFSYIILDLAPTFSEVNLAVLEAADVAVVVTSPEMAGVKATASVFEILESLGFPKDRALLAVNAAFAARPLAPDDLVATLNRPISLNLPYEKTAFVDAINRGVPVVRSAPKSAATRAILKFAADLAANHGQRQSASTAARAAG